MTALVLGVEDAAYSSKDAKGATTTGEVAVILEAKYHVMETFFEAKKQEISKILADGMAAQLATLMAGGPTSKSIAPGAMQKIENLFRRFLSANEIAHIVATLSPSEMNYFVSRSRGMTGAAMRGVSHRKANPKSRKNKPRPLFIDTGLYQASFRAKIE